LTGSPAAAVVITGAMAAGKSTVAQGLAEHFPRAAHVRGDVFRRMVVSGRHELAPEASAEATAQLWLRYQLTTTVADGYARAGFTAVIQDVILGPDLARYVDLLATRPRFVVVLAPRPDVLARREQTRTKKGYGDWTVTALDHALRTDTPRLGLWLDTSHQTPAQTVQEIVERLPEARLPD
jgi:predicted kinase